MTEYVRIHVQFDSNAVEAFKSGYQETTETLEQTTEFVKATPMPYTHYGAEALLSFHDVYKHIHGYLATVVCCLGIIANIVNIIVLTRKNMRSATNLILTGLAISDGLTMCAYLPFALHFYCIYGAKSSPERNTLNAAKFVLFYATFSVIAHTISIWLTVFLAFFRYIFVQFPMDAKILCTLKRAKYMIFSVVLFSVVISVPNLSLLNIVKHDKTPPNGTEAYVFVVGYRTDSAFERFLCDVNYWIQAVLVKMFPCIVLTVLSALIVRAMKQREKKKRSSKALLRHPESGSAQDNMNTSSNRRTNRTTRMLLVVVVIFLISEFPQGVLNLLSGVLPQFFIEIYDPLGDFMDILVLINNGINFLLYCCMSQKFRQTFADTFFRCVYFRQILEPRSSQNFSWV